MNDGTLISDMVRAGVDADMIQRVVDALVSTAATAAAKGDSTAERRRAADRERKRASRAVSADIPQTSADSADKKTPAAVLSSEEVVPPSPPTGALPPRGPSRNRGNRIGDFVPDLSFATSQGMTLWQAEREAANFRDHWLAAPGQRGVKLDWPATWRKWVRKSMDNPPRSQSPPRGGGSGAIEAFGRIAAHGEHH